MQLLSVALAGGADVPPSNGLPVVTAPLPVRRGLRRHPPTESDGGKVARPKGRRRHWSEAQDVLGLKAILGVSAHVAARGTRTKQVVTAGTVVIDPFSQKLSWQSLVRSSFRWLTDSLRSLSSHRTISQKLSDVAVGAGDVGQRETVARRPVGSGG